MSVLFSNNAVARTSATVSSAATSFLVRFGEGDQFPSPTNGDIAKIVLEDRRTGELEIMDLTSRVGDQFNVVRGQEGTNSITWDEGTIVSNRLTAESLVAFSSDTADLQTQVDALVARLDEVEATAEQRKLPIGTVIATTVDTNPGISLGYGTWIAYAAGRTLVGVGNNGQATWAKDEVRGNETHTLTNHELAAHAHIADPPPQGFYSDTHGGHEHKMLNGDNQGNFGGWVGKHLAQRNSTGGSQNYGLNGTNNGAIYGDTSWAGQHGHWTTVDLNAFWTQNQGGNGAHNNVQPSVGTYYWKRTA